MKQQLERIKKHDFSLIDTQLLKNMSSTETLHYTLGSLKQIKGIMDAGIKFISTNKDQSSMQQKINKNTNAVKQVSNKFLCEYSTQTQLCQIEIQSFKHKYPFFNQKSFKKQQIFLMLNKYHFIRQKISTINQNMIFLKSNQQKVQSFFPILIETIKSVFKSFSQSYQNIAQKCFSLEKINEAVNKQLNKLSFQNKKILQQNQRLKKQVNQWNQAKKRRNQKSQSNFKSNQKKYDLNLNSIKFNSIQLSQFSEKDISGFSISSQKQFLYSTMKKQKANFNNHIRNFSTQNDSKCQSTGRSMNISREKKQQYQLNNSQKGKNLETFINSYYMQNMIDKKMETYVPNKQRHPLASIIEKNQQINRANFQFIDKKRINNHFLSLNEEMKQNFNQQLVQPQPKIFRKKSEKKIKLTKTQI